MTCADVRKLAEMVALFRTNIDYELEVAVGVQLSSLEGANFPRNVPKQLFDFFKDQYAASEGAFERMNDGQLSVDCFYADSLRIRCSAIGEAEYIRKIPVRKVEGLCPQVETHRFLFHLKQEMEAKDLASKALVEEPLFLRVQRTWAYKFHNAYLYSFKEVQSGKTREEASKAIPTYEIELELLHDELYLDSKTDKEIALSMIQKALRFCPSTSTLDNSRHKLSLILSEPKDKTTPSKITTPTDLKQSTLQLVPLAKKPKKKNKKEICVECAVNKKKSPGAKMYAGGEDETQRNLRYLIHCGTEEEFMAKRLEYMRKGTSTECLRKGYGLGERHQSFPPPNEPPDDIRNQRYNALRTEDQQFRDEQEEVIQDWDRVVFGHGPLSAGPPPAELRLPIRDDVPLTNFQYLNLLGLDAVGRWQMAFLQIFELVQRNLPLPRRTYPAHFFGFEEPNVVNGEVLQRKREYRFLEHSFDIKRVRSVWSQQDLNYMIQLKTLLGERGAGSLLLAMPTLASQLYELSPVAFDERQGFVLCEIDFRQSIIVFYALANVSLTWYRNIMIQQFVMPRDTTWRVRHMVVPSLTNLMFVLVRRYLGHVVTSAQFEAVPIETQKRYVVEFLANLAG